MAPSIQFKSFTLTLVHQVEDLPKYVSIPGDWTIQVSKLPWGTWYGFIARSVRNAKGGSALIQTSEFSTPEEAVVALIDKAKDAQAALAFFLAD